MDEAEKYKQRLDAIAEKRRLQEEEDKVKREKEEERIKQRQLKRKSLREQWLMEPAPLSPTYQKSPESPTRSKGETRESPEAPEKQAGDGRTKTVQVEDARNEPVLQNGEKGASKPETPEDEGKRNQTPAEVETAVVLTNGGGVPDSNGVSELGESNKHGASEGSENVRVHRMGVTDQIPNDSVLEKEEEEGTLVMRAECVLITDEGDDVSQELTPQEDQQGSVESDKAHLLDPEAGKEKGVSVEEAVKTETPPEALGKSEEKEPPVEPQSQTRPLEGVTVTAVPVYTEAPLPILSSANEAPTQFQEVPLTGPQDKQDNDAGPGEQEPLLLKVEASNRVSEAPPAGGNSPASAETQIQSPEESKTPKQKTCQCCSVM
uniref:Paralemmin 3 n=1 Tax=Oryzias latipes TaxID=8090 RepID=A0A3P9HJB5_ORYLA